MLLDLRHVRCGRCVRLLRHVRLLRLLLLLAGLAALSPLPRSSTAHASAPDSAAAAPAIGPFPGERHLRNIRQLTFGGENAEGYFSPDGRWLVFQSTRDSLRCDQIFRMTTEGRDVQMVSTGRGRTTCAYVLPGGDRIVYASTHLAGPECPEPPDRSQGYVWPLLRGYDLFTAGIDGSDLRRLTDTPGYDAEATVGPDGTILFTSMRDGDPELYTMAPDGTDLRRLTHEVGYDGGAFFSADGRTIVYRAHHPATDSALADYRRLLARDLIRPTTLELFVMNADGSGRRQVTHLNGASFCPFFHPDGKRIIFSSNLDDPAGRIFELYLIGVDGQGLERVTFNPSFDGFPMWSPDGKRLLWGSNRASGGRYDTNLFIADWVD
jgi:Tol biopolymer transport system component